MKRRCAPLLIVTLLIVGCGGGDAPPAIAHRVFVHAFDDARTGIASGDWSVPSVEFEPIPVDPKYGHVMNFMLTPFMPQVGTPLPTNGPLVLYSDAMEVLVFSPMDHPFVSLVRFEDGMIRYGLEGEVEAVPAGFRQRWLLVEGRGLTETVLAWGGLLMADRGKVRVDRYADTGLAYLGFWTDNGGYYYYQTEPGMNYEQTLLAVFDDARARAIPYRYLQLDSWWYFKEKKGELFVPTGPLIEWKPMPEHFPDGLEAFQTRLGLPLIAHNRMFAIDNAYRDRHEFVFGPGMALPTGRGVYDEFMADAAAWGVETYEQDWLVTQYWGVPWLRQGIGNAERWMGNMDGAAADAGRTMQLCMPAMANLLDSLDRPSVTTIRTSVDYQAEVSKESFWPYFHLLNLFAWAVGLPPFKDNFQSSERWGEAEALISSLSAGMVGPSDRLGESLPEVILPTCRSDGLLLKPDRPAFPLDAMHLPHDRPYTVATRSERPGLGRWIYLAAFHLASGHPDRTALDRLFAGIAYDGRDLGTMFIFPEVVTDWRVDLAAELGIDRPVVAYDWRRGTARVVEGALDLPPFPALYDHAYLVLAPVLDNGLALIGEVGKYVTLADRRFTRIATLPDGMRVELAGVPGEQIGLRAYDTRSGRMLDDAMVTIGPDGTAGAELFRTSD